MTARDELIKSIAEQKGSVIGRYFNRYLLGTITRDEFQAYVLGQSLSFDDLVKQLSPVPEDVIQAVMLAITGGR
ncbi:MAG TPA: hypothetical protein ENI27_07450 [bacterium]|nr:hypothetical protein [bacterium]